MPEELRKKLAEAAAQSGRSLNAELVHRLETSCRPSFAHNVTKQWERGMGRLTTRMTLRTKLAFAVLAVLALLAAAGGIAAAVGHGGGGNQSVLALSRAAATKNHTAPARIERILQGNEAGEEASAAQEMYSDQAYPASSISATQVMASHNADARVKSHGDRGHRDWQELGPDTLNVDTLATQSFGPPTQWSGRDTALAVSPKCKSEECRLYVAAAGGGIWMTNNALSRHPSWQQISDGQIPTTSIGSMLIDPTDPSGRTIYVGTGEPNGASDNEAGLGLYKSTDAGRHWSLVPGSWDVAKDRAIGAIAVDPNNPQHIFIGTDVARHGLSSRSGGRYTPPDGRDPPLGLYESKNGGATFTANTLKPQDVVNPGSANGSDFYKAGVTSIQYDPNDPSTLYFTIWDYGLFRSNDNGATNTQIYTDDPDPLGSGIRNEFAVAKLANGNTRIYLTVGSNQDVDANGNWVDASKLLRTDDARTGTPVWQQLSAPSKADPGKFATWDFCRGQCWYDQFVVSPKGRPDTVFIGGVMQYEELPPYGASPPYDGFNFSNGRAVLQSTDGGLNWTDMTGDASHKPGLEFDGESMHPDQHAFTYVPSNPDIWFVGSDGGLIRSSGSYADNSAECDSRGLPPDDLNLCKAYLSRIPTRLRVLNAGLNTLQFQQLSVNPLDPLGELLGGTQDNGTLAYTGSPTWFLPVTGDGGDSGFDPTTPAWRFHTYTGALMDVNFHGNNPTSWLWITDLFNHLENNGLELAAFYAPAIADTKNHGYLYAGLEHVYRTPDFGGDEATLAAHCNTTNAFGTSDWLYDAGGVCGDWTQASPNLANDPAYGSKGGSYIIEMDRANDSGTMYVGTRRGRIFITRNATAASPTYTRIDTDAQPKRMPSGISIDPTDPLHFYITYSGYNAYALASGTAPGHVFEVRVNPTTLAATWTLLDYNLGDQPITDVAYDQPTGDLYVSTDWGVDRLPAGSTTWIEAAGGLPSVATYGLTYATTGGKKAERVLYAATHGRGAYRLFLGKGHKH
jgi:Arc-like DNA binding domain